MSGARVLLYVQYLLGIGHLRRAAILARALAAEGLDVLLVSGGAPVAGLRLDGVRLAQLPVLRSADAQFTTLVDARGRAVDGDWKADRRAQLLRIFAAHRPHALIVESFPFGRRQLRFELLPLLATADAAHPRPRILCSVRDILQRKDDPARIEETVGHIRRWFDHVLVHGDPDFIRFEETFPAAPAIASRLHYTGLVAEAPALYAASKRGPGEDEVIVSVGGGAVGRELLVAALGARPRSRLHAVPWRLLAGPHVAEDDVMALRREAPAGVRVERARSDFAQLLRRCRVSVSQAGYNTVADILRADARAVLVPFRGAGETEQALRAARLRARGAAQVVDAGALDPRQLARALDAVLEAPGAAAAGIDLEGAPRGARLVAEWVASCRGAAA